MWERFTEIADLLIIMLLALAMMAMTLVGCQSQQILSEEEIIHRGTKVYKGVRLEQSIDASINALKKLGFSVTRKNMVSRAALIKTAQRNGDKAGLSWVILLFTDGKDVEIQAKPHAYLDGTETAERGLPARIIDPSFADLWREIEVNL